MADSVSSDYIRHYILFHFPAVCNAKVSKEKKCQQRWFKKVDTGDYDLSNMPRNGQIVEFDNDIRKSLTECDL